MKKIVLLSLTLLMMLPFLTACGVSQKDYDKLASDLAAAQAQIQTLQAEQIQTLQAEKEALRSQLDADEAQIQLLKNQLAEAQSQNPSLQRQEAETELANIQSAVVAMMTDNSLARLPSGDYATRATNDMSAFPNPSGTTYVLYGTSVTGSATLVNYVAARYTKGTYTVDAVGTVTQVTTGY